MDSLGSMFTDSSGGGSLNSGVGPGGAIVDNWGSGGSGAGDIRSTLGGLFGSSGGPFTSQSGSGAGIDPFGGGIGAGAIPAGGAGVTTPPVAGQGAGGFGLGSIPALIGGGMSLYNMFNTSPTEKYLQQAQKLGMGNAQAASQAGKTQLQQYQQGKLSPSQTAAADRYEQQELAKWRQYLASAGIPESSAMADITNKVHQDRLVYEQQLLQQNYNNSMQALGLGGNQLAQQSALNLKMEEEIAKSQADAMAAIGQLFGQLFPGG